MGSGSRKSNLESDLKSSTQWRKTVLVIKKFGRAKRDRTANLYNAIVAVRSRGKIIFDTKNSDLYVFYVINGYIKSSVILWNCLEFDGYFDGDFGAQTLDWDKH